MATDSQPTGQPELPAVETRRKPIGRRQAEARWRWISGTLAVLLIGSWMVASIVRGPVRPSDPVGVACGILATLLLLAAAAYGLRRRMMRLASRRRLGRAQTWLIWHVHGGSLFLVAMLLHTGLGLPQGFFSWCLWLLSIWTVATGFLGLALQRTVPRMLAAIPGLEVHYDRIPELVGEIRVRAEELVAGADRPIRVLYERRLAPVLAAPRPHPMIFLVADDVHRRLEPFGRLRDLLGKEESDRLCDLEDLVRAKLDLDVHFTLQRALRTWLWLHLPASILLLVLVLLHIGSVIYYGGFFLWS